MAGKANYEGRNTLTRLKWLKDEPQALGQQHLPLQSPGSIRNGFHPGTDEFDPSCSCRAWDNTQLPPTTDRAKTEFRAGSDSPVRVPAKPWTAVLQALNQPGCACVICCSLAHTHLSFSCSLLPRSIHIFHFCKGKAECY